LTDDSYHAEVVRDIEFVDTRSSVPSSSIVAAMPDRELQDYIEWCSKIFADLMDYFDSDQYFSRLNDAKYIRYNAVRMPVKSSQCNQQTVHMVHSSGSTRCKKHQ